MQQRWQKTFPYFNVPLSCYPIRLPAQAFTWYAIAVIVCSPPVLRARTQECVDLSARTERCASPIRTTSTSPLVACRCWRWLLSPTTVGRRLCLGLRRCRRPRRWYPRSCRCRRSRHDRQSTHIAFDFHNPGSNPFLAVFGSNPIAGSVSTIHLHRLILVQGANDLIIRAWPAAKIDGAIGSRDIDDMAWFFLLGRVRRTFLARCRCRGHGRNRDRGTETPPSHTTGHAGPHPAVRSSLTK
jgi:hypothetical protein